jgi:hypothetical protein
MRGKALILRKAWFIDHLSITAVSGKSPAGSNVGTVRKGLGVSHEVAIPSSSNRNPSGGRKERASSKLKGDVESTDCTLGRVCCHCPLM